MARAASFLLPHCRGALSTEYLDAALSRRDSVEIASRLCRQDFAASGWRAAQGSCADSILGYNISVIPEL